MSTKPVSARSTSAPTRYLALWASPPASSQYLVISVSENQPSKDSLSPFTPSRAEHNSRSQSDTRAKPPSSSPSVISSKTLTLSADGPFAIHIPKRLIAFGSMVPSGGLLSSSLTLCSSCISRGVTSEANCTGASQEFPCLQVEFARAWTEYLRKTRRTPDRTSRLAISDLFTRSQKLPECGAIDGARRRPTRATSAPHRLYPSPFALLVYLLVC